MQMLIATALALVMLLAGNANAHAIEISNQNLFTLSFDVGKRDPSITDSRVHVGGLFGVAANTLRTAFSRPTRLHLDAENNKERRRRAIMAAATTLIVAAVIYEEERKRKSRRESRPNNPPPPDPTKTGTETGDALEDATVSNAETETTEVQSQVPKPQATSPLIRPSPQEAEGVARERAALERDRIPIDRESEHSPDQPPTPPLDLRSYLLRQIEDYPAYTTSDAYIVTDILKLINSPVPADAKPYTGQEKKVTFGTELRYQFDTGFCRIQANCGDHRFDGDDGYYIPGKNGYEGRKFRIWYRDKVGNAYAIADDEPERRYYRYIRWY